MEGSPSFVKIVETYFSTAREADHEAIGDPLVRQALGHQLEHLALPRRQRAERVVAALLREQGRDDDRIERRAAGADPPDRVGELVDVADPVLEQVADALGRVGQELHGQAELDVLGEHEHADVRVIRLISIAARMPSSVCVGGSRMSTIATSGA